jgi:lysophospholipase L1-like esterase
MTSARLRTIAPLVLLAVLATACASSSTVRSVLPSAPGGPSSGAGARPAPRALPEVHGWVVTGLGDSVTAGTACGCQDFVQQYARLASQATGHQVTAHNLGVPGQTSAGLAGLLHRQDVARQVAGSDIVLVTTGANDLGAALSGWRDGSCTIACFQQRMPGITANVAAVVGQARQLRSGRATEILVTDYWNVFVDGEVGAALGPDYQALSDRVTRLANAAICAGATQGGGSCIDLYAPFKGDDGSQDPTGLLADDGDHPDSDGHRTIAEALAAHGWDELASRA